MPLLINSITNLLKGFYYAVFPSLGGRQFEADNIDQMEWVAPLSGAHPPDPRTQSDSFIARPTIGIQEYLIEPRGCPETSAFIPSALRTAFSQRDG